MDFNKRLNTVLEEYKFALDNIDSENLDLLVQKIINTDRVFIIAAGRSRCVAEMFAMRLAQSGITTHMVGEVTTPAISEDDLLICASSSGETLSVVRLVEKAKSFNPIIFGITATPRSTLTRLSDYALLLPSPDNNSQILGSFSETCLLLILDRIIENIITRTNQSVSDLKANHANIE